MAQKTQTPLSWSTPNLDLIKLGDDSKIPTGDPDWINLPTPVQDSTVLTPTAGERMEAPIEGGALEAVLYKRNTYEFRFEIRALKGRNKPVEDFDGVVSGEYALRLTPMDPTNKGIQIDRMTMRMEQTWSATDGEKWLYICSVLAPVDGTEQVKPYLAPTATDPDPDPDPDPIG